MRTTSSSYSTIWLTLAAVSLPLVSVAAPSVSKAQARKQKIHQLRARLESAKAKKEDQQDELHDTKRQQTRLADQLNGSYQQLEDANTALKESQARLQIAEAAVEESTRRLQEAEERLHLQQQRFGKRIAYYYKEGSVSYLDVLLRARDVSDFLDRQYYMSRIMKQDAEIVGELRKAQQRVAQERNRLMKRREQLAAAHDENQRWAAQVAQQTLSLEEMYKQIREERSLQEQRLQELEEDSEDIRRTLESELVQRLANPRAYRNLPKWSGNFFRPANGPVTSGFGYRFHPILHYRRLHSGIDIGVPYGSPVFAAQAGEVFFASWRGGYGRCIIVLHGGGVSTLYGHLSRVDVQPGQTVRRGQIIGASGNTGLSTGPHLHFEVRKNGVPVNPL